MRPVVIESPYAGDVEKHLRYVRACMADSLSRGEAPFPSHALYTQPGVLRDEVPEERAKGIKAGFSVGEALWRAAGAPRLFYVDEGWGRGMTDGLREALRLGQTIEVRNVPGWAP